MVTLVNAAHRAGLRTFQGIYGDEWQRRVEEYNRGSIDSRGSHVSHIIRQIRNNVTAAPINLPDLRR